MIPTKEFKNWYTENYDLSKHSPHDIAWMAWKKSLIDQFIKILQHLPEDKIIWEHDKPWTTKQLIEEISDDSEIAQQYINEIISNAQKEIAKGTKYDNRT